MNKTILRLLVGIITVLIFGCQQGTSKNNLEDSTVNDALDIAKSKIIGKWRGDGDTIIFKDDSCLNFFDSSTYYQLSFKSCEDSKEDNVDSSIFLIIGNRSSDFACFSIGNINDSLLSLLSLPAGRISIYYRITVSQ